MAKNFLIELGTEELPPTQLRTLAEAFAANFEAELNSADLAHAGIQWFAAPRRLALKVAELAEGQADKVVEKRGPAVTVAFDADGNPTKAAQGWARGNGITVDQAERLDAIDVVDVKICQTMLDEMEVERDDIPSFIDQVSFGPDEVERLVRQGYVYF